MRDLTLLRFLCGLQKRHRIVAATEHKNERRRDDMGCYNCERHDKVERVCESRRMEAFLSRSLETGLPLERIEHALELIINLN